MEKHQKEMNLVLALEKANFEINNLRTLVHQTELNCEVELVIIKTIFN